MTFGPYRLVELLAVGGMAEVYVAIAPAEHGFEKKIVIKRLLPHLGASDTYTSMFIDEAKLAAKLVHPKIVQTFELGRVEDALYMAMEHVEGIDVLELLRELAHRQRRLEPELSAWIAHEVLHALDYAHTLADEKGAPLGIVHRDVSPSNVLLSTRGDVKLVDFGIARSADPDRLHETKAGTLKGKYSYMSPEQVLAQSLDARADLFSVGIVLAEMLTGRRLFAAPNDLDVLVMVRDAKTDRLDRYGADLDAGLLEIARKALAKSVDDRWQSAAEFREALGEWLFEHRHRITNKHVAATVAEVRDDVLDRRRQQASAAEALRNDELPRTRTINYSGAPEKPLISYAEAAPPGGESPKPVRAVPDVPLAARTSTRSKLASVEIPPLVVAPSKVEAPKLPPMEPPLPDGLDGGTVRGVPAGALDRLPALQRLPLGSDEIPRVDEVLPPEASPTAAEDPLAGLDDLELAPPSAPRPPPAERPGTPRTPAAAAPIISRPMSGKTPPLGTPAKGFEDPRPPRLSTHGLLHPTRASSGTVPPELRERAATGAATEEPAPAEDGIIETPIGDTISQAVNVALTRPALPRTTSFDDLGSPTFKPPTAPPGELAPAQPPEPPALDDIAEPADEAGDLATMPPLRVLFRLMTTRATGLLVVSSGTIKKEIYVREGQPEYVSSNVSGELFGNYLVAKGVLSDGELAMALAMMPHYGGKLGDTLVGLGLLKPLEVFRHLVRQVRTRLIEVCGWTSGRYAWYEGRVNTRDSFRIDFNAFEMLGAAAIEVDEAIINEWAAHRARTVFAPSRTRRVGPDRFAVKGLVDLFDSLDGTATVEDLTRRLRDRDSRMRCLRMLRLLEACELAVAR